jgi:hypothetical protein
MADHETSTGGDELQFDRVVPDTGSLVASDTLAVVCSSCQKPIATEYYDVNGHTVCNTCRTAFEAHIETPTGPVPFLVATLFGVGAGIVGAIIYYGVIALLNLEIGIVAILIGYMVGYSVRKGAKGRGGLRFQILAAVLTYTSVAFAYTPIAIKAAIDARRNKQETTADANATTAVPAGVQRAPLGAGELLFILVSLFGAILTLPVLVVVGSFPSGLISGLIIVIGMRQAWRMTGALRVDVLGPYRVGASPVSAAP